MSSQMRQWAGQLKNIHAQIKTLTAQASAIKVKMRGTTGQPVAAAPPPAGAAKAGPQVDTTIAK